MKKIFLGIDVGTSKICILALAGTKPLATASQKNLSDVKTQKDFAEQNPEIIRRITVNLLSKIKKKIKAPVSGIGITGQMHGMLFVDKNLKPLTSLITWQDKRSKNLIPEMLKKINNSQISECGSRPSPGYMGSTLYWFYKNKLVPKNVYKACFIHDWIGASLTGEKQIFTDPSDAASSGIFNVKKMDWHWKIIDKLGIKKQIFPKIKKSGEIIGFTKEGIPVGCALGDNQASIFGSTFQERWQDVLNINIGTGSQVSIVVNKFKKPAAGLELRPYLNGKYILVGASLNGGAVYSRLKDFLKIDFRSMNKLAGEVPPGCDSLCFNPYFFGERNREGLKASISGLNMTNFTPGHLCRSALEGMVKILYNYYENMGEPRKYIIGSGNAIKKNKVLHEVIEQIFNMKLKLNATGEEAAYGAALLISKTIC